jgi:N-acetylmuramoyl-L-alanine amidase
VGLLSCFKKKKRPKKVIMHCAATPDSNEPGARWYELDIEEVRRWHVKGRGWKDVGYHYFIKRDGTIQPGRPVGSRGAHTKGRNYDIGVCYAGTSEPTDAQKISMRALCRQFREEHGISPLDWHCHHEYADKDCPGFSLKTLHEILMG